MLCAAGAGHEPISSRGVDMSTTIRRCCDCRDGEHDNYNDDVVMTIIRDSDTKKFVKRGYMCGEHRQMYFDDGYEVIEK